MSFRKIISNPNNLISSNLTDKTNYTSLSDTNDIIYYAGTNYGANSWVNPLGNNINIITNNLTAPTSYNTITAHPTQTTVANLPYVTAVNSEIEFLFSNILINIARFRLSIIQTDASTSYEIIDTFVDGFINGAWEEINTPGFLTPGSLNQTTTYQLIDPGQSNKFYSRIKLRLVTNGGFGIDSAKIARIKIYGLVKQLSAAQNSILFTDNTEESGTKFKSLSTNDLNLIYNSNNVNLNFKTSNGKTLLGPLEIETTLNPSNNEVLLYNNSTTRFESEDPAGTTTGKLVRLQNIGGNPGLPAVDGSLLLNLPSGGGGSNSLTRSVFTDTGIIATKTKTSNYMVFEGTSQVVLNSLQAGTAGEEVIFYNNAASHNSIILFKTNTGVTPANDFLFSGTTIVSNSYNDFTVLLKGQYIRLIYDGVLQRWIGNAQRCINLANPAGEGYTGMGIQPSVPKVCPFTNITSAKTTVAFTANTAYYTIFKLEQCTTFREFIYETTVAPVSTSMKFYVFDLVGPDWIPGKMLCGLTTTLPGAQTAGIQFTTPAVLAPGYYIAAFGTSTASTFRAISTFNNYINFTNTSNLSTVPTQYSLAGNFSNIQTPEVNFRQGGTALTTALPFFLV